MSRKSLINKAKLMKTSIRKVMHKHGKGWIISSLLFFSALGTTSMIGNADTIPQNDNSANNQVSQVKTKNTVNVDKTNGNNSSTNGQGIQKQAIIVHQNLLNNAMASKNKLSEENPNEQVLGSNNQVGKDSSNSHPNDVTTGTYEGLNYKYYPSAKSLEFTSGTLTWNGNSDHKTSATGMWYGFIHHEFNRSFTTPSCIQNAQHMTFDNNVDVSKATNMEYMFSNDTNLRFLKLGNNFDTHNVTDMEGMFRGDTSLQELDLGSKFDTSDVTNMASMFQGIGLDKLNLGSKFNTKNVTENQVMFWSNLNYITIESPNTKLFLCGHKLYPNFQPYQTLGIKIMYKETQKDNNSNAPYPYYTLATPNDFGQGNVGTFTTHKHLMSPNANVTVSINYVFNTNDNNYKGKQGTLGSTSATGSNGGSFLIGDTPENNLPAHYHVIKPNQSINYNSGTVNVPIAPDDVDENIIYKDSTNQVGAGTINGPYDYDDSITSSNANNLPSGYQLINSSTPFEYGTNGDTVTVQVSRIPRPVRTNTDTFEFNYGNSNIKTIHLAGQSGTPISVAKKVPKQYNWHSRATFTFDGKAHVINLGVIRPTGNQALPMKTDTFDFRHGNDTVKSIQLSGQSGTPISVAKKVPKQYNWHSRATFTFDGKAHVINLGVIRPTGNQNVPMKTDTFVFIHGEDNNGSVVEKQQLSGQDGSSINVSNLVPAQYNVAEKKTGKTGPDEYSSDLTFKFNGGTHYIYLGYSRPNGDIVAPTEMDVDDTIDFKDGNNIIYTEQKQGRQNDNFDVKNDVPKDYTVDHGQTTSFKYDGQTHTVKVARDQSTVNINYVFNTNDSNYKGRQGTLGRTSATGNNDDSFVISSNPNELPPNYHVINPSQSINYNAGTVNVPIVPDDVNENIIYKDSTSQVGIGTVKGLYYYDDNINSSNDNNLPSGYQLANSNTPFEYGTNGDTVTVQVSQSHRSMETDTFDFKHGSDTVKSIQLSGQSGTPVSVAKKVPKQYNWHSRATFAFDGKTHVISLGVIRPTGNQNVPMKTDTIQFKHGNSIVKQETKTGQEGTSFNVKNDVPSQYNVNSGTQFTYDGQIQVVQLGVSRPNGDQKEPIHVNPQPRPNNNQTVSMKTDTFDFRHGNDTVESIQLAGQDNKPIDVAGFVPSQYNVHSNTNFTFDGGTHVINLGVDRPNGNQSVPTHVNPQPRPNGNQTVSMKTDTFNFDYGNQTIKSIQLSGQSGIKIDVVNMVPSNYNEHTNTQFAFDGQTHVINLGISRPNGNDVTPVQMDIRDNIIFNGDSSANTTEQGKLNANGHVNAPINYHYTNGSNGEFIFNGGTHTFDVSRDQSTVNINYVFNTDNSNYKGPQDTLASTSATGNDDGLFIIGNTPKNLPTNYRVINPNQFINYDAKTVNVPIAPNNVNENITYKDGASRIGTGTINGTYYYDDNINNSNANNLPSGYRLANNNTPFEYGVNGDTVTVQVSRILRPVKTDTDHIKFNGDSSADTTMKGTDGTQGSVSAPSGYHFSDNKSSGSFTFNNGTHTFDVTKNTVTPKTDTDTIDFNGDNGANKRVNGINGTKDTVNAPQGYHYINGSTGKFTFDNGTHTFDVDSNIHTVNIDFNGDNSANTTKTGNYQSSSSVKAPSGYHFTDGNSTEPISFGQNGRTYTFNVTKNAVTPKIDTDHINFNGDSNANTIMKGIDGTKGNISAPNGYHFSDNKNSESFTYNNSTHTFNVTKNATVPPVNHDKPSNQVKPGEPKTPSNNNVEKTTPGKLNGNTGNSRKVASNNRPTTPNRPSNLVKPNKLGNPMKLNTPKKPSNKLHVTGITKLNNKRYTNKNNRSKKQKLPQTGESIGHMLMSAMIFVGAAMIMNRLGKVIDRKRHN